MAAYFREDPIYRDRFSRVWLWTDWVPHFNKLATREAADRPEAGAALRLDLTDPGIDLVAEESDGSGWCAIQCKCYAAGTWIGKPHLDLRVVFPQANGVGPIRASTRSGEAGGHHETLRRHNLDKVMRAEDADPDGVKSID